VLPGGLLAGKAVQLTATISSGEDANRIATGNVTERVPFVPGYYTVFNVEQFDGLILPTQ
jgi:antirestriction protein ArdC